MAKEDIRGERERLRDLVHPDPEAVARQLEHLYEITHEPLVAGVDPKQVGMIALMAIRVIRDLVIRMGIAEKRALKWLHAHRETIDSGIDSQGPWAIQRAAYGEAPHFETYAEAARSVGWKDDGDLDG